MDDYRKSLVRLIALEAEAGICAIKLARLASTFSALFESGALLGEGAAPIEELMGVPDPDELAERDADMSLMEAARVLEEFFGMSVEGQAKFEVMIGLEGEG